MVLLLCAAESYITHAEYLEGQLFIYTTYKDGVFYDSAVQDTLPDLRSIGQFLFGLVQTHWVF